MPFYSQLSIIKANQAFRGYVISYKAKIVERKDSVLQLEVSKLSIKDLFSDLLGEIKGFKYQITAKVLLKKMQTQWRDWIFSSLFNSVTKSVINHRFKLEESFQEILYKIDAWISNGSGWIIDSIESHYINITTYRPLLGSSLLELPIELKKFKKRTN